LKYEKMRKELRAAEPSSISVKEINKHGDDDYNKLASYASQMASATVPGHLKVLWCLVRVIGAS
jgi:hypothetical protein